MRCLGIRCCVLLSLWCAGAADVYAGPVLFSPAYGDSAGEGFFDPALGSSRRTAFEYALGLVGGLFDSRYAGETVSVSAQFNSQGGSAASATLASATPTDFWIGIADPIPDAAYPSALASHRAGEDLNGATPEILITFNSDVDNSTVLGNRNWFYGASALPGVHIDFVTVALHEIAHGLGFTGFLKPDGAYNPAFPTVFDHYLNTEPVDGLKLTTLASPEIADPTRAGELAGNDLWWDGPLATAANGGVRPKLHAPGLYSAGSSTYHLDEGTLGSELMSPIYSGPDHLFSPLEIGMLADMGWTLAAVPEVGALTMLSAVTLCTAAAIVLRRRPHGAC